MMSRQQADVLAILAEVCNKYPDWPLGQLVANVAVWADEDIWDLDDEELLQAAQAHLEQLALSAMDVGGHL